MISRSYLLALLCGAWNSGATADVSSPTPMMGTAAAGSLLLGAQAQRPNLVVMFADNLGYGDVGALGAPATRTPNVDSLARDGVRLPFPRSPHPLTHPSCTAQMTLKHWISAASMCSPSRASLLTGRYHMRNGIYPLTIPADAVDGLPTNETTLAEHLRQAGFATMCIGKCAPPTHPQPPTHPDPHERWSCLGHLGHRHQFLPTNRGFDHFLGLPFSAGTGSTDHARCGSDLKHNEWLPLFRDLEIIQAPVNLSSLAIAYATAAEDFIAQSVKSKRPFFLCLPNARFLVWSLLHAMTDLVFGVGSGTCRSATSITSAHRAAHPATSSGLARHSSTRAARAVWRTLSKRCAAHPI